MYLNIFTDYVKIIKEEMLRTAEIYRKRQSPAFIRCKIHAAQLRKMQINADRSEMRSAYDYDLAGDKSGVVREGGTCGLTLYPACGHNTTLELLRR